MQYPTKHHTMFFKPQKNKTYKDASYLLLQQITSWPDNIQMKWEDERSRMDNGVSVQLICSSATAPALAHASSFPIMTESM